MRSIRATLLLALLGTLSIVIGVAGWLSYRAGLQEAGEMFDARLVQSTRVLVGLVDEPITDLARHPGDAIVLRGWHGRAQGVGRDLAFADGHAYENKLAFQIWDARGRLLLRSDSAPLTPLTSFEAGFADVAFEAAAWRAFTLRSPSGLWFQSAERSDIRDELAADIAEGTLLPLLVALPLLALAIWTSVALATRSLRRLSDQIGERDPERLVPLDPRVGPREARGLVEAINGLLLRLDTALVRERRFVADAAHELRTPISALHVHADNAAAASDPTDRQAAQVLLRGGIVRIERLVSQLLALNRAENIGGMRARGALRLDALVRNELEDVRTLATRRQLAVTEALAEATVMGDELALSLLVRNVLENAVRYTPVGGRIHVAIMEGDAQTRCVVEDSGPGIAPEARERVFDRFYRQLGSGEEGSGLGLAIAREVASAHGGHITLDGSEALGGLRVTVVLASAGTQDAMAGREAEAQG